MNRRSHRFLCSILASLALVGPAAVRAQSDDAQDFRRLEVSVGFGLVEDIEYGVRTAASRLEGAWGGSPLGLIASAEVNAGRPVPCEGEACSETRISVRLAGGLHAAKHLGGRRSIFAFVDAGPVFPFALSSAIGIGGNLIPFGGSDLLGVDVQYRWAYRPGDGSSSRAIAVFLRWLT